MDVAHIDSTQGEPPAEWPEHFQGEARLQPLPSLHPGGPALFAVHFRPGGRSRPHVHEAGQVLVVTDGEGIVGDRGGRRTVRPGDVIAARPGEWHWHGATPTSPLTHVTVQTAGATDWDVDEGDWAEGYEA
jgi:quercetin dioxygenase-like cupin family protein